MSSVTVLRYRLLRLKPSPVFLSSALALVSSVAYVDVDAAPAEAADEPMEMHGMAHCDGMPMMQGLLGSMKITEAALAAAAILK